MKSSFIKYYSIAEIPFSVESFEEVEPREPFSLFSTEKSEVFTEYKISEEETLPEPRFDFLFEDSNYRTYKNKKGKEAERYCGFFHDGKILDPEYAVIRYSEEDFKAPHIILSASYRVSNNEAMIFRMLFFEHLMIVNRAMILHSSYIVTEMGAVLFTAPSGTGKSTQADLWAKYRGAFIVNGDCSIIRRTDGIYKAFGVPFSGSSKICHNTSTKLAAIVFLGQADKNSIKRLRGAAAFRAIFEGLKLDVRNTFDAEIAASETASIAAEVPVFRLDCVPDESAVDVLYGELKKIY